MSDKDVVLVVEDEDMVRELLSHYLSSAGYSVLAAASGPQAVEIFHERADAVDLVLLDVTLPDMSGEETLRRIRDIRPDVGVVLTSGRTEAEVLPRFREARVAGFLQKPYRSSELLERIRTALAESPPGDGSR